jgi:hypothetical protein
VIYGRQFFLRFFPLPNSGAYGPIASVKWHLASGSAQKCTYCTFDALKVIEVFPDASYLSLLKHRNEQAWRLMDEIKTLAKPQLYNVADPVSQGGAQMEEGETGHGPSIVIMIANGRFEIQT